MVDNIDYCNENDTLIQHLVFRLLSENLTLNNRHAPVIITLWFHSAQMFRIQLQLLERYFVWAQTCSKIVCFKILNSKSFTFGAGGYSWRFSFGTVTHSCYKTDMSLECVTIVIISTPRDDHASSASTGCMHSCNTIWSRLINRLLKHSRKEQQCILTFENV